MWGEDRNKNEEREKLLLLEMEQRAYSEMEEAKKEQPLKKTRERVSRKKNVRYYVDGERATARQVSHVQEDGSYMADYVYGEGGRIEEIHYDKVKPK